MIAVLIVGNSGGPFIANLSFLLVCLALGMVVHHLAPNIHRLRGWRQVAANVAMTATAVVLLLAVSQPKALLNAAVFMECFCLWGWESWCCYFEAFTSTIATL